MNGFEGARFPHIRYIDGSKSKKDRSVYYMGGEPDENHRRLIFGKEYSLSHLLYSPDRNTPREYVWTIKQDDKYYNVDPNNFGTIVDLRERRINQIIEND